MRAGVCRQNGQNQQYREFTRLTGAENKAGRCHSRLSHLSLFTNNTQNRNLQGYKLRLRSVNRHYNLSISRNFDVDSYSVTAVTGMVNGKEMDMLKAGIFL